MIVIISTVQPLLLYMRDWDWPRLELDEAMKLNNQKLTTDRPGGDFATKKRTHRRGK